MRDHPLKFRAWHKPTKKMFPVYGFDNDFVWQVARDEAGANETVLAGRKDCVIMQFTCLLDKNKKEIYEGDIVQAVEIFKGQPCGVRFKAVIIYNEFIGSFQISFKSVSGYGYSSDDIYGYQLEVIGNLAENAELVEPQLKQNGGNGKQLAA